VVDREGQAKTIKDCTLTFDNGFAIITERSGEQTRLSQNKFVKLTWIPTADSV